MFGKHIPKWCIKWLKFGNFHCFHLHCAIKNCPAHKVKTIHNFFCFLNSHLCLFSAQVKSPTSLAESLAAQRISLIQCCTLPAATRWCGGRCIQPCASLRWWRPTFPTNWHKSWLTGLRQKTGSMMSCSSVQVWSNAFLHEKTCQLLLLLLYFI